MGNTKAKVVIVCPQCGSPDVTVDATARWDIENQSWDLSATFDNRSCGSCLYDGHSFGEISVDQLTPNQKDFVEGRVTDYVQ